MRGLSDTFGHAGKAWWLTLGISAATAMLLPLQSTSGMLLIERLVLWGPVVVVPLGLQGQGRLPAGLWLASSFAVVSGLLAPGLASMGVASVWLLATGVFALQVALRRLTRLKAPPEDWIADLGVFYLPVGAAWWFLSRKGGSFMQFDAAIVALTAAHFHFAGFAASAVAARVGPLAEGGWRKLWFAAASVVALGPPLVAVGITFSPLVEVLSASLLAAGVLGLALVMGNVAWGAWCRGFGPSALGLATGAGCLFGTMALAAVYASGEFFQTSPLPIPTMVRLHGFGNALGFATLCLWSLSALPRSFDSAWCSARAKLMDGR